MSHNNFKYILNLPPLSKRGQDKQGKNAWIDTNTRRMINLPVEITNLPVEMRNLPVEITNQPVEIINLPVKMANLPFFRKFSLEIGEKSEALRIFSA
jgi:hypothetical protein